MKKLYIIFFIPFLLLGCGEEDVQLVSKNSVPTNFGVLGLLKETGKLFVQIADKKTSLEVGEYDEVYEHATEINLAGPWSVGAFDVVLMHHEINGSCAQLFDLLIISKHKTTFTKVGACSSQVKMKKLSDGLSFVFDTTNLTMGDKAESKMILNIKSPSDALIQYSNGKIENIQMKDAFVNVHKVSVTEFAEYKEEINSRREQKIINEKIAEAREACKTTYSACLTINQFIEVNQDIEGVRQKCRNATSAIANYSVHFMRDQVFPHAMEYGSDLTDGRVNLLDDAVQFQNGFGAWRRHTVICHYFFESHSAFAEVR